MPNSENWALETNIWYICEENGKRVAEGRLKLSADLQIPRSIAIKERNFIYTLKGMKISARGDAVMFYSITYDPKDIVWV